MVQNSALREVYVHARFIAGIRGHTEQSVAYAHCAVMNSMNWSNHNKTVHRACMRCCICNLASCTNHVLMSSQQKA